MQSSARDGFQPPLVAPIAERLEIFSDITHTYRLGTCRISPLGTVVVCLPGKQEVVGSSPTGGAEFLSFFPFSLTPLLCSNHTLSVLTYP